MEVTFPGVEARISDFEIDDSVEFRAGIEYVFEINKTPIAVRCGYSFIPDHSIQYKGQTQYWKYIYSEGEDDNIFSLGFGAVFKDVQIDVAGSYGDFVKEFTFSLVHRFGK